MATTITYADKVNNTTSGLPAINKVRDVDMNEIKDAVNDNAALTDTNTADIAALEAIAGYVPFTYKYNSSVVPIGIAAGELRLNSHTPSSVTHVFLHKTDNENVVDDVVEGLQVGSYIYFQSRQKEKVGGLYEITVVTDSTTYMDYTVTVVGAYSVDISGNTGSDVAVSFTPGVGAGGGESNTTSNSGAGQGLALAKSGVDLPFKSLTTSAGIIFTSGATELSIDSKEEFIYGTRSTNGAVTGAQVLDWELFKVFEYTLTGNATLSDLNLPTGTETKVIELIIEGDFTLTLPSYWEALPSNDTYDGTKRNHLVVSCIVGTTSSEDVIYSLQTLTV